MAKFWSLTGWTCIGLIGAVFAAFIVYLIFVIASGVTGNTRNEYRCVQGVVETRNTYFGVGVGSMTPLDGDAIGDPNGVCGGER